MNTRAQTKSNLKMNQPADIKYQFTKTKICRHFLENRCVNKDNCNYAHVLEELRPLPNLQNTKLCKSVKKKIPCCNPNCKYAHKIEKLQPSTDLATYKTTLCYFWKKKKCMNQDKCRFAHGIEEIRPLRIPKEGKTERASLPLSDTDSSLGTQQHQQKGKPSAKRTKEGGMLPGKKWGKQWDRRGGNMWGRDAGRGGGKREGKVWEDRSGKAWEDRSGDMWEDRSGKAWENRSGSKWSNERESNRTTQRTAERTAERTNQRDNFLLEEERVPNILSNIHLFENSPVMENDLFQLNDNFLNICNSVSLDSDALYTPPGETYSSEHEQKESDENNSWEDSVVDLNFLNLDYLNDEEDVAKYELFRGSGLDINLENLQALSMQVNHDAYTGRSLDANMWSIEEGEVNRNYGVGGGRHPEISQSNNPNVFLDASPNESENVLASGQSGNNEQNMERNQGIISNQLNIFNAQSIEELFSFDATSSEKLLSDSEFFAQWCKSIKDRSSKHYNSLCLS
ncbi:zinc finger C-x8-C-x5-C-x3-H type, putative [Plasmodium vivax]|uniref:Zinc finger C-x8-C-x5-C-x3-H type, putative n=1 Tax=Plasmodium vivax TaxID=5855 RepID=A0A1G4GW25_PLAVI|nr:zinc finger C-x8-C-x5-C-x3-H type, putative [Plasmodium vivax]